MTKHQKCLTYCILVCIIGLAAYLRMYRIEDYMTFLGDEGRDVLVVKRMIVDGKWTLLGPTASVGGFYMGPIYYYFMLPFLWASNLHPTGPAFGVALVGTLTVLLVYLLGAAIANKKVGLMASALYALSPLVIAYSRSSWNPNIVPFFAISTIYLLWKAKETKDWNYVFLIGLACGIGIQLHYTFLFLYGVIGVWMLLYARSMKLWKQYALGVIGFLIGWAPFLAFELRHGFSNTKAIASFITSGKDTGFAVAQIWETASDIILRLFARTLIRFPDVGHFEFIGEPGSTIWHIVGWVTVVVLVLGTWWNKTITKSTRGLLFLWLGMVIFCFGLYRKSIYDYYFTIIFPLPFIMTALSIDTIGKKRIGQIVGVLIVVGLGIWNWMGRPFVYEPNRQMIQVRNIAQAVVDQTGGKPFNFALITGGNSDHAYRYFMEIWGKSPTTIENDVIDPERKTVTDQLLIVCEYPTCEPIGNSLWEVAGFGRAQIAGQWDVSVVKVFKLIHYVEKKE